MTKTLETIKAAQQIRVDALKAKLLDAFELARETIFEPITYSDNDAVNGIHKERAASVYGNLIDLAITDLQAIGFVTDHTLDCLEAVLKEFPAEDVAKMGAQTPEAFEVDRKYMRIYYNRFVKAVREPVKESRALSPA